MCSLLIALAISAFPALLPRRGLTSKQAGPDLSPARQPLSATPTNAGALLKGILVRDWPLIISLETPR